MLDELDLGIIGALQVDGRASWRKIADALDASFTTVTRRGNALLESHTVRIAAMENLGATFLVELDGDPTSLQRAAERLAQDQDIIFLYHLSSPSRLIMEVHARTGKLERMSLVELPSLEGISKVSVSPVLEYFRTVRNWTPKLLSDPSRKLLEPAEASEVPHPQRELDSEAEAIIEELVRNGRLTSSELASITGIAEPKARRLVNSLLASGAIDVRAIVEPGLVGFGVEAIVWIRVMPNHVSGVGKSLSEDPSVRYAVMSVGKDQIVANTAFKDLQGLRSFLSESEWVGNVYSMSSSLVIRGYKRGGVVMG